MRLLFAILLLIVVQFIAGQSMAEQYHLWPLKNGKSILIENDVLYFGHDEDFFTRIGTGRAVQYPAAVAEPQNSPDRSTRKRPGHKNVNVVQSGRTVYFVFTNGELISVYNNDSENPVHFQERIIEGTNGEVIIMALFPEGRLAMANKEGHIQWMNIKPSDEYLLYSASVEFDDRIILFKDGRTVDLDTLKPPSQSAHLEHPMVSVLRGAQDDLQEKRTDDGSPVRPEQMPRATYAIKIDDNGDVLISYAHSGELVKKIESNGHGKALSYEFIGNSLAITYLDSVEIYDRWTLIHFRSYPKSCGGIFNGL